MPKLYQTYTDSVGQYIKENSIHRVEEKDLLKGYAKWLDGFRVADDKLSIAALQGARKIDRETILALVDEVGLERAREVIKKVTAKHRHYSQWQDENVYGAGVFAWLSWKLRSFRPKMSRFGVTKPTESLPEDKEKDLHEIRKTTKNSQ